MKFLFGMSVLGQIMMSSIALADGAPSSPIPLTDIYTTLPVTNAMMGMFSTGLAFADLNDDGYADMIVANGNDMSPQPLSVFLNLKKTSQQTFEPYPSWYSSNIGYMMRVAVGDLNADGWLDVAVALSSGELRNLANGGVAVYLNRAGTLESLPSFRTGDYAAMGCAFGDVDADGDLDLVVAAALESTEAVPLDGRARIYLNEDGRLDPFPAWISARGQALGTMDVVVADVNQDGWMDVAFAANRTAVYYGRQPKDRSGEVPLTPVANWLSEDVHEYSFSIDAGSSLGADASDKIKTPSDMPLSLVVSSGCFGEMPPVPRPDPHVVPERCKSRFLAYRPVESVLPRWWSTDEEVNNPAEVLLADLDADGYLDLIANQWGRFTGTPSNMPGAPLWIFQGSAAGFPQSPDFESGVSRVGEALAVADLEGKDVTLRTVTFEATRTGAVVTLPDRIVLGIVNVEWIDAGQAAADVLSWSDFAWAPASNWISLAVPLEKGDRLKVTYQVSPVLDIGEATWNPQYGNDIYYSFL